MRVIGVHVPYDHRGRMFSCFVATSVHGESTRETRLSDREILPRVTECFYIQQMICDVAGYVRD